MRALLLTISMIGLTSCAGMFSRSAHLSDAEYDKALAMHDSGKYQDSYKEFGRLANKYPEKRAAFLDRQGDSLSKLASGPYIKGALRIRTGKADPGPGFEEIGPVSASTGSGCGMWGTASDTKETYKYLKNIAAVNGADYVQIYNIQNPRSDGQCYNNTHSIDGILYKKKGRLGLLK